MLGERRSAPWTRAPRWRERRRRRVSVYVYKVIVLAPRGDRCARVGGGVLLVSSLARPGLAACTTCGADLAVARVHAPVLSLGLGQKTMSMSMIGEPEVSHSVLFPTFLQPLMHYQTLSVSSSVTNLANDGGRWAARLSLCHRNWKPTGLDLVVRSSTSLWRRWWSSVRSNVLRRPANRFSAGAGAVPSWAGRLRAPSSPAAVRKAAACLEQVGRRMVGIDKVVAQVHRGRSAAAEVECTRQPHQRHICGWDNNLWQDRTRPFEGALAHATGLHASDRTLSPRSIHRRLSV